jgi:hypothetical protein
MQRQVAFEAAELAAADKIAAAEFLDQGPDFFAYSSNFVASVTSKLAIKYPATFNSAPFDSLPGLRYAPWRMT